MICRSVLVLALLSVAACRSEAPHGALSAHQQAQGIWAEKLETATLLVEADNDSLELRALDEFFHDVTGISGLTIPWGYSDFDVSPQAESVLRRLGEWCEENCSRLTVDPESGQVRVLPPDEM